MTDSLANTTTVKNVLAHVISPKIVRSGGIYDTYETRFDLVNVDTGVINNIVADTITVNNILFQESTKSHVGSYSVKTSDNGLNYVIVPHSKITQNSLVFAEIQYIPINSQSIRIERVHVKQEGGAFFIYLSRNIDTSVDTNLKISWFVPKF